MKEKKSLSIRRFIVAILFFCSATLFMTNLGVSQAAGFDSIGLGLVIAGVATWAVSGLQSVYRRARKLYNNSAEENHPIIRPSTHSAVNASLLAASAVFFIAGDAYDASTPALVRGLRLGGSSLWFISAVTGLMMSIVHERRQEDNPELKIRPLGVHPDVYQFTAETEYLIAGILFAAAIYSTNPIPVYKAVANSCWLLASSHEVVRTLSDVVEKDEEAEVAVSVATLRTVV